MANQEDIDRYKKGKDAWNQWAEAELKKPAEDRATVYFSNHVFSEHANFSGFIFPSNVFFNNVNFKRWAKFDNARFEDWVSFANAEFSNSTDFSDAVFTKAPNFHNAKIHQDTRFSFGKDFFKQFSDIKSKWAEGSYRTLKLAMSGFQAHREEAGFFKLEMMARAHKEPRSRKWLYWLYEKISDYGQGIYRPFKAWLALGLAAFLVFSLVHPDDLSQAYILAQAQALPLVGAESEGFKTALTTVFPSGTPVWYHAFRAFHMAISSGLIFLFLLALRNRFRIK